MHTLHPSREDDDGPRTVKLLVVPSLCRIVVYSEVQPSDDRVKVSVQQLTLYVCIALHVFSPCMCERLLKL